MSIMGIYLLLLTIVIRAVSTSEIAIRNDKCKYCQFMVATFEAGLRSTSRQHFSGGDTAWEEKNLGKYSTSETRLVEVLEGICKKHTVSDNSKFSYLKDVEFKCNELLEEHEELLETYYYKHQEENMTIWMCVDNLKVCCPPGHYGKECTKCPGLQQGFATCFGHGKCHGDESRQGIGKCKCDQGYTGLYCQHCDSDYFASKQDENTIECEKCFTACVGGCTGAGPKGCTRCRSGWEQNEEFGCVDVDECTSEDACTRSNEKCVNSEGSFTCECMDGYVKNEEGQCELNIQDELDEEEPDTEEAKPNESETSSETIKAEL